MRSIGTYALKLHVANITRLTSVASHLGIAASLNCVAIECTDLTSLRRALYPSYLITSIWQTRLTKVCQRPFLLVSTSSHKVRHIWFIRHFREKHSRPQFSGSLARGIRYGNRTLMTEDTCSVQVLMKALRIRVFPSCGGHCKFLIHKLLLPKSLIPVFPDEPHIYLNCRCRDLEVGT